MSESTAVEAPDAPDAPDPSIPDAAVRDGSSGSGFDIVGTLLRRRSASASARADRPPVYGQHHYLVTGIFLVLVALIAPEVATSRSDQFLVNLWLVYCITGIGFYWVFGLAGKFAFCQTFMMALGGFTSAWLTRTDGPDQPFAVGVLGAVAATCLIAFLLGTSVRRAQHFYFAIATLALESIGHTVFKEWTAFTGPNGTTVGVPPASLAGREFLLEDEVFWLFLGTLAVVLVLACMIERSPLRREAVAARDNLLVANVAGVRASRHRLVLLVLGSGMGGLSGALIAHWNGVIGIDSFGIDLAIGIFLMLLLGGSGSMWGPVLGAAFYVAVPDLLSGIERYSAMVYGLVLLVVVIAMPDGLVGVFRKAGDAVVSTVSRVRRRSGGAAPGLALAGANGAADAGGAAGAAEAGGAAEGGRAMLRADEVRVTFGGVCAVDGVSLSLAGDELLGLVGPNGSGKTTFLNAVCGVVPARGRLTVDGRPVLLGRPRAAWDAGIARVFQSPQTFEDLACIENVLLSSADQGLRGLTGAWLARPVMWRREKARWRAAMEALELVGLERSARDKAALLTYGQRRLLELARAVVGRPKVLLLDEPSAGLNDGETAELCDRLVAIQARGIAVLVVDHKVDFLDVVCDRIVVLELGQVIAEGRPEVVWKDARVMSAYLGVPEDAVAESALAESAVAEGVE